MEHKRKADGFRARRQYGSAARHVGARIGEGDGDSGVDLRLGLDQLAHHQRAAEALVGHGFEFFEPVDQSQSRGVQDLELLLDADGEVPTFIEDPSDILEYAHSALHTCWRGDRPDGRLYPLPRTSAIPGDRSPTTLR